MDSPSTNVRLLFASHNQHKLHEMEQLLSGTEVVLVSPQELGISKDFDVEETGTTFQENAALKAKKFAGEAQKQSGKSLLVCADDSGLCVNILNGEPGIHSKRFVSGSDLDRNQAILHLMTDQTNRGAYFITVLCLYDSMEDQVEFFEGKIFGTIALENRGTQGFGYDSIFIPEGYNKTFAELGSDLKNKLSHRARAAEKLKKYIQKIIRKHV